MLFLFPLNSYLLSHMANSHKNSWKVSRAYERGTQVFISYMQYESTLLYSGNVDVNLQL